jgi:hypothetical protein
VVSSMERCASLGVLRDALTFNLVVVAGREH